MDFEARVRRAIVASGLRQVEIAARCGVTPAAVNNWINRGAKDMRVDVLFALAAATGREPRWLATGEGPERHDGNANDLHLIGTLVPVIPFPTTVVVDFSQSFDPATMAIDRKTCPVKHGSRTFATKVPGDAMRAPVGQKSYPAGCLVYVDPDHVSPAHDSPVFARLASGHIEFAQYMSQAGRVWLRFLNDDYPPILDQPFEVVGCVLGKWEDS